MCLLHRYGTFCNISLKLKTKYGEQLVDKEDFKFPILVEVFSHILPIDKFIMCSLFVGSPDSNDLEMGEDEVFMVSNFLQKMHP